MGIESLNLALPLVNLEITLEAPGHRVAEPRKSAFDLAGTDGGAI